MTRKIKAYQPRRKPSKQRSAKTSRHLFCRRCSLRSISQYVVNSSAIAMAGSSEPPWPPAGSAPPRSPAGRTGGMDYTVTLMDDRIVVDGELADRETIDRLIGVLQRNREAYPTRAERFPEKSADVPVASPPSPAKTKSYIGPY